MMELLSTFISVIVVLAVGAAGTLYFGAITVETIKEFIRERQAHKHL